MRNVNQQGLVVELFVWLLWIIAGRPDRLAVVTRVDFLLFESQPKLQVNYRDLVSVDDLFRNGDRAAGAVVRDRAIPDDRFEAGLFQAPFDRENKQLVQNHTQTGGHLERLVLHLDLLVDEHDRRVESCVVRWLESV